MKQLRYLTLAVLLSVSAFATVATAKTVVVPKMYMFGFAASFNDTIVHFTEIQALDSVTLETKHQFLMARNQYSYQLSNYLTHQQMPYRTCVVFYDRKLNKLQKKFLKMKKLYATSKNAKSGNDVRTITSDEFKFTTVKIDNSEVTEVETDK